tara:strand:+ start:4821 stop:5006 length:186 start_codon:yes stop_codon:yes gene_type:complete
MKANKTDSKLDTKLVPDEIGQTSTKRFKLKFTNYAAGLMIPKFQKNSLQLLPVCNKGMSSF